MYNVLSFPKSTLDIDQELLRLRITLNTSLAQLLPAPLITTSVFFHVSILAVLNYIASDTKVAHLKNGTCLTVLLVLLFYIWYATAISAHFSGLYKILRNFLKHFHHIQTASPPRSHPIWLSIKFATAYLSSLYKCWQRFKPVLLVLKG